MKEISNQEASLDIDWRQIKLLTVRLRGRRKKYYTKTVGYKDFDENNINVISKVWRLFDIIPIWTQTVFTENVPLWAVINYCCIGSTNWKSEKPWLIDASRKEWILKSWKWGLP